MNRIFKHLKYPWRHPALIPRAVSNYLRLNLLGEPRLRGVEFAITYRCLCQCQHCSAYFLKSASGELLSTAQIKKALQELWELGAMNFNLTGGEALLHPDLEEIVHAAHPENTVVSLATSGMALDRDRAHRIRAWGVRIVTISLDSAAPEIHDRSRGTDGCFQKVMEATQHCRQAGIDVFWCTIMTNENAANGDLLRMVEMAEQAGVTLTINFPCPVGKWRDKNLAPAAATRQLHQRLMRLPHVRWEGHSNYRREGCPAGIEKLYISPQGDVMPCPFIHISYGNLHRQSVKGIWRLMLDEGPFNTIRDGCPISGDEEFIRNYIEPIYRQDTHPLPHQRLPRPEESKK